jgi:hypothetical protein
MNAPTFMSVRGRIYNADQVRKIVLARLADEQRRCPIFPEGWRGRVIAAMSDAWLRRHNGEIPGALVRALRLVAMGVTAEGE